MQLFLSLLRRLATASLLAASITATTHADTLSGPAPDFALPQRGGGELKLSQLRGQVVMLNFWASWCKPCRQEMPLLEQLASRYAPLGFTLVGVNIDDDPAKAELVLKDIAVTFPIVFDTQNAVSQKYALIGMPSTVFIDRQGNMRYLHTGYRPGDEQTYDQQIRALVRE